jgi:chemotaxis signal transduction protein
MGREIVVFDTISASTLCAMQHAAMSSMSAGSRSGATFRKIGKAAVREPVAETDFGAPIVSRAAITAPSNSSSGPRPCNARNPGVLGDQTVVIPLTHVLESLRPETSDVEMIGTDLMVLNNRGQFLPIVPLDNAVGATGAQKSAQEAVLIVVETENHGQAVLMVDSIVDQRQFVIKSLEANFQPVVGVAGATILGDGKVALILDVDALVADNFTHTPPAVRAAA